MKIIETLSPRTKGILLIIAGILLVLNSLGIIDRLDPLIAIGGGLMIVLGFMMSRLHEKIYVLITKGNPNKDDDERPLGM